MKIKLAMLLTFIVMTGVSYGTIHTWTGAVDTDWNNAGNWDTNGIPVDFNTTSPGLDFGDEKDKIVFNAANLPTLNLPGLGSSLGANTPGIELTSGGTLELTGDLVGSAGGISSEASRTVFSIGGGASSVTLNLHYEGVNKVLCRYPDGVHNNFYVGANGTWNLVDILAGGQYIRFGATSNRTATITIDGGTVYFAVPLRDVELNVGNYIDFTSGGGSFMSKFGYDFQNIDDINAALGDSFRSSTGETLSAADNGDGTYTVSSEPDTNTYADWLIGYAGGMESQTNLLDDAEPDGLNNLVEYALGGDPTVDDAATVLPDSFTDSSDGTNRLYHVYNRRGDALDRGLTYSVLEDSDLVSGSFATLVPDYGVSLVVDGFESVTNRIYTDNDVTAFMKLEIEINE